MEDEWKEPPTVRPWVLDKLEDYAKHLPPQPFEAVRQKLLAYKESQVTNVNPSLNRGTIAKVLQAQVELLQKEVEELRKRILWLEERT